MKMRKTMTFTLAAALAALVAAPAMSQVLQNTRDMSSSSFGRGANPPVAVDRTYRGIDLGRNTSIGIGATTIYSQPSRGSDGPSLGTQRGSSSSPSYGGMIEWRF
jgi:hypothetical protein